MLLGGWLYRGFVFSFCLLMSSTELEFNLYAVTEASGRESVGLQFLQAIIELACAKVYPSSLN